MRQALGNMTENPIHLQLHFFFGFKTQEIKIKQMCGHKPNISIPTLIDECIDSSLLTYIVLDLDRAMKQELSERLKAFK